jgi:hypothetical protein
MIAKMATNLQTFFVMLNSFQHPMACPLAPRCAEGNDSAMTPETSSG